MFDLDDKKKNLCALTAGSCKKQVNQIRDCQIERSYFQFGVLSEAESG